MVDFQEKPYEFIPFPSGKLEKKPPEGHQHYAHGLLNGAMVCWLTAKRPVHVASGFMDMVKPVNQKALLVAMNASVQRKGGLTCVLPGSSVKGMLRSTIEAITPSCVATMNWRTNKAIPRDLVSCNDVKKLCTACRLFGMSGRSRKSYQGRIFVEDALMSKGESVLVSTPLLWTPARTRGRLPGRYMKGETAKGRKFYYHGTLAKGDDKRLVASTGSIFTMNLRFENLEPQEMGLLLTALGKHPEHPFLIKIGGGKPVGLGSMEVEIAEVRLIGMGDLKTAGRAGKSMQCLTDEDLQQRIREWTAAAEKEKLIDRQALTALIGVLKADNLNRRSPEEVY